MKAIFFSQSQYLDFCLLSSSFYFSLGIVLLVALGEKLITFSQNFIKMLKSNLDVNHSPKTPILFNFTPI